MTSQTQSGNTAFSPFDPEFRANPYPSYPALLEGPPHSLNIFVPTILVARYDHVLEVLHDPARFSTRRPEMPMRQRLDPFGAPTVLLSDPPVHTRLRKLVSKAFTPRRIRRSLRRFDGLVVRPSRPYAPAQAGEQGLYAAAHPRTRAADPRDHGRTARPGRREGQFRGDGGSRQFAPGDRDRGDARRVGRRSRAVQTLVQFADFIVSSRRDRRGRRGVDCRQGRAASLLRGRDRKAPHRAQRRFNRCVGCRTRRSRRVERRPSCSRS